MPLAKIVATKLIEAIRCGKIVMFTYDGLARIVKPFALGISTRDNLLLSGYQIGGKSARGIVTGWKYFEVDKMKNVAFSRTNKTIPSGYRKNDRQFKTILAQR